MTKAAKKGNVSRKLIPARSTRPDYTLKWRLFFFSVAGRPSVAILETDKMGRSDQVQEAKDGRIDKVTEFRCHLGNFGCLSFKYFEDYLLPAYISICHTEPNI